MSDEQPKKGRTEAVRGAVSGVGHTLSDKVRQQLDATGGQGDSQSTREAAGKAVRSLAGELGKTLTDRVQQQLDTTGAEGRPTSTKDAAAAAIRGLVGDVQQTVKQGVDAVRPEDGEQPMKRAATALSGLVGGVGQGVADLVRQELGSARSDAVASAKAAGRGAGLLGAAAATGNTAILFAGVAIWQGLGSRIGFARSALVVTALSGTATAVLASRGVAELARVRSTARTAKKSGKAGPAVPPAAAAAPGARRPAPTPPQTAPPGPATGPAV